MGTTKRLNHASRATDKARAAILQALAHAESEPVRALLADAYTAIDTVGVSIADAHRLHTTERQATP